MKILITGGSGLLGQYLNSFFSNEFDIITTYQNNLGNCGRYNSTKLDLSDFAKIEEIIFSLKPDVVIHLGAVSRPADADRLGKETVFRINVEATKKIADCCYKIGARLIFTSTELVYDGNQGAFISEKAKLNPVSLYAESKLWAEEKIKETFDNWIILRCALLYGIVFESGQSSFDKMFRNLRIGKQVELFYDQYRSPLSVLDAVRIMKELIKRDIKGETINYAGRDRLSRYELGELLCDHAGFSKELLIRKSMFDSDDSNKVQDVSLNIEKLIRFGIMPIGVNTALRDFLEFIKQPRL